MSFNCAYSVVCPRSTPCTNPLAWFLFSLSVQGLGCSHVACFNCVMESCVHLWDLCVRVSVRACNAKHVPAQQGCSMHSAPHQHNF